jgi:hypothetical protein
LWWGPPKPQQVIKPQEGGMRIELSTAPGCPNAAARTVLVDCLTARGIDKLRRRAAGAPIKFCIAGVEAAFDGEFA